MRIVLRQLWFVAACVCLATAAPSRAESRAGRVRGKVELAEGTDASVAVVYLRGRGLRATPAAQPQAIIQRNKQFDPRLLVVVRGSRVQFPNDDRIMHNVFSRSQGNAFDLGYYKKGDTKEVVFNQPGIVDVYCNIHPHMVATVLIVENDFFVRPAADGTFELRDVPAGEYELVAWTPRAEPVSTKIVVSAGGAATASLKLKPAPQGSQHMNKEGMRYGRYK